MHALRDIDGRCAAVALLATATFALASIAAPTVARAQRSFESADAAIEAAVAAITAEDRKAVLAILGEQYEDRLITADWEAERPAREKIAAAAKEKLASNAISDGRIEWIFGADDWPFPFQTVRGDDGAWRFDTENGLEVVLDRRIGRNELAAIAIVNAYVDAQIEYAKEDRDGDGVLEYAQRLGSSKGKRDGLYWASAPGEPESPFGPLVTGAESYLDRVEPGDPIRGYYFRVLKGQGENARGGAYDYVVDGNMVQGFALVAYPAWYGNTGVMTFLVNHRGEILQKAIPEFGEIDVYDPDDSWTVVEEEGS